LERIAAFLQDVDSIYDIVWARDPETNRVTTYGDVRLADEQQFSVYNFEKADADAAKEHFDAYWQECKGILDGFDTLRKSLDYLKAPKVQRERELKRYPIIPALDLCLKCSHLFNILDARGAISVTERVGVIARVRALAVGIAKAYVAQQQGETACEEEEPVNKRPKAKNETVNV
jgi:glycyl-tRNA synthetase alpha chain